jgi:hypothetical protein
MPPCEGKPRPPAIRRRLDRAANHRREGDDVAIAELQIRQTAFSLMIQHIASNQRLPSATIKIPFFPVLDNMPLDSISCVGCTFSAASNSSIYANLDLQFRYYTGLAAVKAAGSLQQPPTQTANHPLRLELSVSVTPTGKTTLVFKDPLGLVGISSLASYSFNLDSLSSFTVVAGAIVLSDDDDIVAIRLASDPSDTVNAPATNRLVDGSDWTQFVPGSVFADVIGTSLGAAVANVVSGKSKYGIGKPATAAYWTSPILGVPAAPPFVVGSAEVVAINACPIFKIDVSVDLLAIVTFVANGPSIETTLNLSWSADSTWCQIADFFVATPIAPFIIANVSNNKASHAILGSAVATEGFREIGRGDNSITYRQQKILPVPAPLVITASQFNNDGLMVSGGMKYRQPGLGLQGWVAPASSGISTSCSPGVVTVKFIPPQVGLVDHNDPGTPPRIFPDTLVVPANAWVVVPGTGNDTLETLITFAEPPSGHLPVGTATSVYLSTDCGMRWVDLGTIPADHPPPTIADIAAMLSFCFAKSASWKDRVLSVKWLPRPGDDTKGGPVIRQWLFGLVGMAEHTQLQFVAIGPHGAERLIGTVEGTKNLAAKIITAGNETLEIRSNHGRNPAPEVVAQRWISPVASLRLREPPLAIAAAAGLLGLRGRDGTTSLIEISTGGELRALPLASLGRLPNGNDDALIEALDRAQHSGKQPWHSAAQWDARTVAVLHADRLVVGSTGELQNVLTL